MSEIIARVPHDIGPFEPQQFRTRQAKLDAIIELAGKLHDWPLLDEAIDVKMDEQRQLVGWWDETVRSAGNPSISHERGKLPMRDAEQQTGITNQQVSRWGKSLENPEQYREKLRLAAYRKAGLEPEENHRAEGTGENEWFTPAKYIEAAREVMGGIDLDPATHPIAQQTVRAINYFTAQDDGLKQEWHGRVWLNPPYAQPLIGRFIDKLNEELDNHHVSQAVVLTHNYTDTAWFHAAEERAAFICFTRGRIRFVDAAGSECSPTQGQAFFYYGNQREDFCRAFSAFGFIR